MKKTFIVLSMLFSVAAVAKEEIVLRSLGAHSFSHPQGVPSVEADGDDICIKCDTALSDVNVVIRDQYGNVMHQSIQTVGPHGTTIYVPDHDGDRDKTTIDLYFDRNHLVGYFRE